MGDFDQDLDHILTTMHGTPHIFNLGHGINKDTPIEHVERMIKRVQTFAV
jgi:uroporphyrinogen decarboxylase